jgi:hypothetical protein
LSSGGAYEDEMGNLSRLSDQELDRLLTGKEPPEGGDFGELAAFVCDVAAVLPETPDEATAARHLAAIVSAAQLQLEHESSAPRPSVNPSGLNRKALYFRGRRKMMSRNPFSSLASKLALAVIVLAAFGGTAYAGVLPDPLQGAVADVADTVGVSLPGAENASDDGAVEDVDNGTVGDTDYGSVGDTNGGDEGAVEDDQGDNDQGDQGSAVEDDQGDNDQGDQGDNDQGDQGDNDQGDSGDQGDQGSVDEGDQGSVDQGDQGSADEGDQGGNDGGEASGDQGDGDN